VGVPERRSWAPQAACTGNPWKAPVECLGPSQSPNDGPKRDGLQMGKPDLSRQPVAREARTGSRVLSLSPGRGYPRPVGHDCFEARGRGDPRSCSEGAAVDAQLAVCRDEGDVSSVKLGVHSIEGDL
jgi:hypothetical protein